MFTRIMKWFSVTALLLGLLLSASPSYRIVLEMAVCVASIVVLVQAMRLRRYMWGMGFLVISALFNPAMPVTLSHRLLLGLEWFSIGAFLISLAALKNMPLLSMSSIADRTPGSEAR
jgi:hypothetical protein